MSVPATRPGAEDTTGSLGCRPVTATADATIGLRAAERLARTGTTEIGPGLVDPEFDRIEQLFGFAFADDHRAFLAAGLPVRTAGHDDDPDGGGWGWPDWRALDSGPLREQVGWPADCILRHIAGGGWHSGWGRRPYTLEAAMAKARRRLADVPRLIPVYGHRYLPAGRGTAGRPVLSVPHLTDIIVYGQDLDDYVLHEFQESTLSVPFWRDHV